MSVEAENAEVFPEGGGLGASAPPATKAELVLMRCALNNWPVTDAVRQLVVNQMASIVNASDCERSRVSAAKVIFAADGVNVRREVELAKLPGPAVAVAVDDARPRSPEETVADHVALLMRIVHNPVGRDRDRISALTQAARLLGLGPKEADPDANMAGMAERLVAEHRRMDVEIAAALTDGTPLSPGQVAFLKADALVAERMRDWKPPGWNALQLQCQP